MDKSRHPQLTTVHDPCNYVRKSQMAFGDHHGHRARWITQQCCDNVVDMVDDPLNNFCCGGGGGAWAMPYTEERLAYGKVKADQIKATGAELVVAPCHNCRDQIMKGLPKVHDMGNYKETMYIWELVAESLVYEPWSEEEIERAHQERDAQNERDGIELEEEM
ncbi:MAG: heterodisulfide reductase-related iron-sulfur binding cluster [Thermodesulfobacteriota bacterium]